MKTVKTVKLVIIENKYLETKTFIIRIIEKDEDGKSGFSDLYTYHKHQEYKAIAKFNFLQLIYKNN